MTDINQVLDLSGFSRQFDEAAKAILRTEKNVVRFIDATQKLVRTDDGTPLQKLVFRLEVLNKRGRSVIKTYEQIDDVVTLVNKKTAALTDSTEKLAKAQAKLVGQQAEAAHLRNQFAFQNSDPSRPQSSRSESNKLNAAQNDLVRFVEAGKASASQVKAIYDSVINGTFQAGDASSRLLRLVLNLVDAELRQGRAAVQASDQAAKAMDKQIASHDKFIAKLNAELALEEQKAAILQHNASESNKVRTATRTPGQDLRTRGEGGKGTVDQIQAFLNAERALEKLAFKGKASFAEIEQAIARVRKGTLTMASATNDAERAALKLVAAEKRIGQEAVSSASLVGNLVNSFVNLGKITAIGILLGNMFRLQSALEDSIRTANEFSIRIGQIQTVEDGPTFGTERWAQSLRELSDSFGIPILNQAEAAYQTLSNQVAQGAEAIVFLDAANKLAVTGVTDTAAAVETLTSVLKAYNKPVEEAELVSARLFRIAELGRVKIEELSGTFGRVTVPAALLGVSLEELGAAITVTTVQGFRFEAASTLIRNIILKLIRPTSDLKEFFKDIGVNSGEAAIQTFGLAGVLAKLEERTRGSSTEIGELFHELRANTGIMSLLADGGAGFADALQKIRDTDVNAFMEDTNRILGTSGQQLKIAAEQAKNFFEVEIGQKAIDAAASIIRELGGVTNIITTTGKVIETAALVALPLLVARMGGAAVAAIAYARAMDVAAVATARFNAAAILAGGPVAAIAAGIGVVVVGAVKLYANEVEKTLHEAEAANIRLFKSQQEAHRSVATLQRRQTEIQNSESERRSRNLLQEVANRRKVLSSQQNDLKKAAESLEREFGIVNKRFGAFLTKAVNLQEKKFADARRAIEQSVEAIRDSLEKAVSKPLEFDLKIAGLGKRSAILDSQIEELQKQAQAAATSGDFDAFDRLRKQIENLAEERMNTEVEFAKERSRLNVEERQARKKLTEAASAEEEDEARRTLDNIQRQADLLRTGTQSQIELERERQQVKEQIAKADNVEDTSRLTEELALIEQKQKDINKLVIEERNIRLEGLNTTKSLAESLLTINDINTQRAAQAARETAELKAAQFSYNLLTKEAESFDSKEILAKDSAEEITTAISKQQGIYARLIALQQKLGAGEETSEIVREKALNLQQQGQAKLEQLRSDDDQKRIDALKKQFDTQVKSVQDLTKLDLERIAQAKQKLDELRQIGIFTSSRDVEKGRGRRGFLDGTSVDTLMDRNVGEKFQTLLQLTQPLSQEAKGELGQDIGRLDASVNTFVQAVQRQAKDPSQANTDLVNDLAQSIETFFSRFEGDLAKTAVGSDETAREQARNLQLVFNEVKKLNEAADKIFVVNKQIQAINTRHAELTGDAPKETAKAIDELPLADPLTPQENAERSLQNLERFNQERSSRQPPQAPGLGPIPGVESVDEEVGAVFGDGIKEGVEQAKSGFVASGQGAAQAYANEIRSGQASRVLADAAVRTAQIQARTYQEQQKLDAPDVAQTIADAQTDATERAATLGLDARGQGPFLDGQGNLVTRSPAQRNSGFVGVDAQGNLITKNSSFEDAAKAGNNAPVPFDPNSPEGKALAEVTRGRVTAEQSLLDITKGRVTAEAALAEEQKKNPNFGKTPEQVLEEFRKQGPKPVDPALAERQRAFEKRLEEFARGGGTVSRGLPPLRTPQEQAEREARFNAQIQSARAGAFVNPDDGASNAPIVITFNSTVNEAASGPTTAAEIERVVARALRARAIEFRQGLRNKP